MASSIFVDFHADVPALTQDDPGVALLPLLKQLKGWEEILDEEDVAIVQINGAMTNLIFRAQNLLTSEFVLVRVFGEVDTLFSREDEQRIFAAVAHAGLGPRLLACFCNGRVEEFLLDQSISAAEMREAPVALCVAAALACFHFSELAIATGSAGAPLRAIVWPRLRTWARAVAGLYSPAELAELRLTSVLPQVDALEAALSSGAAALLGFCHNDLQYGNMLLHTSAARSLSANRLGPATAHAVAMADRAVRGGSPPPRGAGSAWGDSPRGWSPEPAGVLPRRGSTWGGARGFSPDELEPATSDGELVADLLHDAAAELGGPPGSGVSSSDGSGGGGGERRGRNHFRARLSVRLIDYEYAGVNPVAFDIANNWCEYAADYHADPPHQLDYSLLPNKAHQERFVRAYLHAADALREDASCYGVAACVADDALDAGVEALRAAALAFLPVSHLLWGLWGLIQARVSQLPDFDFTAYAQQRLQQFRITSGPLL
ncbi:hypothetical protein WJX81_004275 [Elliptochloris bilobata]|uniref:Choline kinase n=1 Tax=Elliptochloris bilobata TaxID=381761 RepID=A0AAW1QHK8_9CHLO